MRKVLDTQLEQIRDQYRAAVMDVAWQYASYSIDVAQMVDQIDMAAQLFNKRWDEIWKEIMELENPTD